MASNAAWFVCSTEGGASTAALRLSRAKSAAENLVKDELNLLLHEQDPSHDSSGL